MNAVIQKPKPNTTISGVVQLSGKPVSLTRRTAMVAVPQAYQPIWVKPRMKSESLLPSSPKVKRDIRAVFSPDFAAM